MVADLTSPWWNDRWRFAAIAVLAFAPLAAHGLHVLAVAADALLRRVLGRRYARRRRCHDPGERRHGRRHRGGRLRTGRRAGTRDRVPALAALGLAAIFVLSSGLYMNANTARTAVAYQDPGQLDTREVKAMRWLSEQPDIDGQVMNDPNDGSPYMLALFGVDPVFGHILNPGTAPGETQQTAGSSRAPSPGSGCGRRRGRPRTGRACTATRRWGRS